MGVAGEELPSLGPRTCDGCGDVLNCGLEIAINELVNLAKHQAVSVESKSVLSSRDVPSQQVWHEHPTAVEESF